MILTTFNNNKKVFFVVSAISHVIHDEKGCWVWLTSSKSIHVKEDFDEVMETISSYHEEYYLEGEQ